MEKLNALWRGQLDLDEVFWTWVIFGRLLINVTSSVLFLAFITLDIPVAALVAGYGYSVPYNILVVTGLWRSAGRYHGPRYHADLARAVTLVLMGVLTIT